MRSGGVHTNPKIWEDETRVSLRTSGLIKVEVVIINRPQQEILAVVTNAASLDISISDIRVEREKKLNLPTLS